MAAPVNNTNSPVLSKAQMSGIAVGASAIGSIAGYMSSTRNTKSMLASMTRGIESNKNSYLTRLNSTYEQEDALTRQMGDAMSARGLENLKAQSRLRVASASSGLSGNSIDEIVNQTNYDELFDTQILRSRVTESKTSLMYQRVTDKLNFMTQGRDIASQLDNAPDMLSSILAGLQSGIGAGQTYMALDQYAGAKKGATADMTGDNNYAQTGNVGVGSSSNGGDGYISYDPSWDTTSNFGSYQDMNMGIIPTTKDYYAPNNGAMNFGIIPTGQGYVQPMNKAQVVTKKRK